MRPLFVGDTLPDFNENYHSENLTRIMSFKGEKNIVLIFFPTVRRNGCEDGDCCFSNIISSLNNDESVLFGIARSKKTQSSAEYSRDKADQSILMEDGNVLRRLFGITSINLGNYTNIISEAFRLDTGRIIVAIDKKGKVIYKTDVNQGNKCLQDEGHRLSLILWKSDI